MKTILIAAATVGFMATPAAGENWPRFRGPTGQGVSRELGLPTQWTATTNVAWKTALPGLGWSSPIVWNDFVFITATTAGGADCHILALDRRRGDVIWDKTVLRQVPERKETKNSFASPTPVTDGERVYAVFADGSAVAVDFAGEIVWINREVKHYSRHGLGASPILYRDRLIMPYDGSNRVDVPGEWPHNLPAEQIGWQTPWDEAQVVAFDTATGARRWTARRGKSRIAHATPNILHEHGSAQLVSTAGDVIQGFDLDSGRRLWSIFSEGEGVVPSVVIGDGLLFTCSGYGNTTIRTVRTGGNGVGTDPHIAWENRVGTPNQASMLYVQPYLYAISDQGVLHCYQADSGEVVWRHRVGGNHSASPVFADGRLYTLSEEGETAVIQVGREYEVLATNQLEERCQASIAISQGNLFIRTAQHLYCIGQSPQ